MFIVVTARDKDSRMIEALRYQHVTPTGQTFPTFLPNTSLIVWETEGWGPAMEQVDRLSSGNIGARMVATPAGIEETAQEWAEL